MFELVIRLPHKELHFFMASWTLLMLWACLILGNPTIEAMLQDSAAAIEKKEDKWCNESRLSKVVLGMRSQGRYGLVWYLGPLCLHLDWICRNSWSKGFQQWLSKRLGMFDIRWRERRSPHFSRIWIIRVVEGYSFSASPWFISIKGEIIWCNF